MNQETILFETDIKPSFLLKQETNFIYVSEFSRGVLRGKIFVLFSQGFISKYTYERYLKLLNRAEKGELILRNRG